MLELPALAIAEKPLKLSGLTPILPAAGSSIGRPEGQVRPVGLLVVRRTRWRRRQLVWENADTHYRSRSASLSLFWWRWAPVTPQSSRAHRPQGHSLKGTADDLTVWKGVACMAKRILVWPLLGSLATGSMAAVNTEAQVPSEDEALIRKRVTESIERFNRKDAAPLEFFFTTDADFVNVYGVWLKGIAEIEAARRNEIKGILKDANITLIDLRIRFVRPDVAIVVQEHEMRGKRSPTGDALPPERQVNTRVLVKEAGKWLTASFQNTAVRPVGSSPVVR